MIQHILLATNGSVDSSKAEDYALYLAETTRASLTVLFVGDDRLCHYGEVDQLVTETTKEQFISYVKTENNEACCRILKKFSEKAADRGILFEARIRTGEPVAEIVSEAREKKANFLVIGSGGAKSRRFTARSSSTCSKIIKKSPCPVLITNRS